MPKALLDALQVVFARTSPRWMIDVLEQTSSGAVVRQPLGVAGMTAGAPFKEAAWIIDCSADVSSALPSQTGVVTVGGVVGQVACAPPAAASSASAMRVRR
ncbi:MAG TPA: hypothetical protein VLF18_11235 [Tahibacter sp.]|nr:hypothetical protein [Tahibacter sp.]